MQRSIVTVTSEKPFDLRGALKAAFPENGGSGSAVWIYFENLPPGASLVSCQGYLQAGPTAVRTTSWGKIRRIYRQVRSILQVRAGRKLGPP